ncbi:class I adenylate-forming enzyme family protein [Nocardia sp. NPDC020380]|uniref:class I adenylate-forming enzyme family protein n=1 Tax=Nocardia sp. NPDC020380 TaxID=3364309 RepID=UPI00378872AE
MKVASNPIELLVACHVRAGNGDRVACTDLEHGATTYGELERAAAGYADALTAAGIAPGSRVLVVSDDSIAMVVTILGLWWHGCIPVPVNPILRDSEIAYIAENCNVTAVRPIVGPERAHALTRLISAPTAPVAVMGCADVPASAHPADFAPDAELLVQYTSGSTGHPRGVRHSLNGIRAVLDGFGGVLALTPDDVVLSTAKLSFGYGFGNSLLFPLAAGARVVLLSDRPDPFLMAAALHRHRPSIVCAVPRAYAGLLELYAAGKPVDLSSVRLAVSAGEHLPIDLARRLIEAFGVGLINGLGVTEILHIVVATDPAATPNGSVGRAVPGMRVTVRDETGAVLPDGMQGRLHVAGGSVALGYLDTDSTMKTFADGGVYTGDVGWRDAHGDLHYLCRADDLLNLGGFKVAPQEIEAVLRATPGVTDCAVVARRDSDGLERALAHVVAAPGWEADAVRTAIRAAFKESLAPYKRPYRIEVHDRLPVTSVGKLARFRLRGGAVSSESVSPGRSAARRKESA